MSGLALPVVVPNLGNEIHQYQLFTSPRFIRRDR